MRIFGRTNPCDRHRPALIDWVEHRVDGPETPSAFDHLARCRRCELELTEIALTVIALRRLAQRASALEPSDGWGDLRARLEPPRRLAPSGRSRWALFGSMLGPAVVAAVVLRATVAPGPLEVSLAGDGPAAATVLSDAPRPMYDSGPRRLTEGIVIILSGRAQSADGHSTWLATTPSSTDRRDTPPVLRRTVVRFESTLPRTATRS